MMDQNFVNNFAMVVDNLFNNVFTQCYASMTNAQSAWVRQKWGNERNTVINQLIQLSSQRPNGQMSQQEVEGALRGYIQQSMQQFQQSCGMSYGNMMPNMGYQMPQMGAPMMGNMYGGQQFRAGWNTGMPMMGTPQPIGAGPTYAGNMPTPDKFQMASMYDLKPTQPPMQPVQPTVNMQAPVVQQQQTRVTVPAPVVTQTPVETKMSFDLAPYKEPTSTGTKPIKNNLIEGKIETFNDSNNQKFTMVTGTCKKWVKSIHTTLAEICDKTNANFVELKYKTYKVINQPFDAVSKTFFEIKDVIQKANASTDKDYTSFERLEAALHMLDDKSVGVGKLVQNLIIDTFNRYVYAMNIGDGQYIVDTCDKIVSMANTIKDNIILGKIDAVVNNIVDHTLMDNCIYDVTGSDTAEYVSSEMAKGNQTFAQMKAKDKDAYAEYAKNNCVLVSDERTTIWTNLVFGDTIEIVDTNSFKVMSKPIVMDYSPVDCNIEFMIKHKIDYSVADLFISADNTMIHYQVIPTQEEIYLRGISIF